MGLERYRYFLEYNISINYINLKYPNVQSRVFLNKYIYICNQISNIYLSSTVPCVFNVILKDLSQYK